MNISQPKIYSFFESLVGVAIGYGIALLTQIIVFPWFGLEVSLQDNLLIGGIFTIVSIARSYFVRRLFNWIHVRQNSVGHKGKEFQHLPKNKEVTIAKLKNSKKIK